MIPAVGYHGEAQAILKIRSALASSARWSDSGHVLETVLGEGTSPPFALWKVISLPGAFWRHISLHPLAGILRFRLLYSVFVSVYCTWLCMCPSTLCLGTLTQSPRLKPSLWLSTFQPLSEPPHCPAILLVPANTAFFQNAVRKARPLFVACFQSHFPIFRHLLCPLL